MTFNEAQRDAILETWTHLAPSQLAVLAERLASVIGAEALAVTSPTDCAYALQWSIVAKDPSLTRAAPTPEQYVEHMSGIRKTQGLDVTPAHRLEWLRTAQEMDADRLLASVPATSEALKTKSTSDVLVSKKPSAPPSTLDDWLQIAAEEAGFSTVKAFIQSAGPQRARGMAEHLQAAAARPQFDERAAGQRSAPGKAKADQWAASPEAAKMSPAAKIARWREMCAAQES